MTAHVVEAHAGKSPSTFPTGLWRLADPKISLASVASIGLGTLAAAASGPIHYGWLALTVAGILAIEIAKNAYGEIADFDSGADLAVAPGDRTPFSGGKRVLVDGLLTRRQTRAIATAFYGVGIALGIGIAWFRAPEVLWIGVAGIFCAYSYHAEPLRLSYRGLGELVVGIAYGPLVCSGAYLVQRQRFDPVLLWLAIPLGVLIATFLWINEFPDCPSDRAAGKRTLVVRLGRARASRVLYVLVALAYVALLAAPLSRAIPATVWLGLTGLPFALAACRVARRDPQTTQALVPAQRNLLRSFVLFALGSGIGLVLG